MPSELQGVRLLFRLKPLLEKINTTFSLLIQSGEPGITWSANFKDIFHPSCVSVNAVIWQKYLLLCVLQLFQSYVAD